MRRVARVWWRLLALRSHPLLLGSPNMAPPPRSLTTAFLKDRHHGRPSSAPPDPERSIPFRAVSDGLTPPHSPICESPSRADSDIPPSGIDLMPQLQRSESSIVKTRSGSVLSRGFILKTDYWPSGTRVYRLYPCCSSYLDCRTCARPWANRTRCTKLQGTAEP